MPTLINTPTKLPALTAELQAASAVALDTETVFRPELTVDGIPGALRVISLAWRRPSGELKTAVIDVRDLPVEVIAPVFADVDVIGWNANFDEQVLLVAGLRPRSWWDAMLAESLLNLGSEGRDWYLTLAEAARRYLGVTLEGKGGVQLSYDAASDLEPEQVLYAAEDARVTLEVAELIRYRLEVDGLTKVADLEMRARPVIAAMVRDGFAFDMEAWRTHLDTPRQKLAAAVTELATLTGSENGELSWNPGSDPELREALNTHAVDAVQARYGRLLERTDKLDKQSLGMFDHPLATAVLAWREHSKTLSTYGEGLERFWREGRIRPRYLQALVSTGRLASRDPNGQNLSPAMKPYITPGPGRVFVHGDLSQAELRVWAQLSGERAMIEAFASGEDFHAKMAGSMFGVDMAALHVSDPAEYKRLRSRAKALSFGQVYGMAGRALAQTLSSQGVETSVEEANGLLKRFASAFPQGGGWLAERDRRIRGFANDAHQVDWVKTFRLYELRVETETLRKRLKRSWGYLPSSRELAAAWRGDPKVFPVAPTTEELDRLAAELDEVYATGAAVVFDAAGLPVRFESRTPYGRRRFFEASVDTSGNDKFSGVLTAATLIVALSDKPKAIEMVKAFAAEHALVLPDPRKGDRVANRVKVVKAFEGKNRPLRLALLNRARVEMGESAWRWVLDKALADSLRSSTNAHRNHPIQGCVADVVLDAFGELATTLPASAKVVMSVHDSVVIEVDESEAAAAKDALRNALEGAMARACPGVTVVADVDLRRSLDDRDVLDETVTA
jgi:DNA polymerase I-like protein with 3'-5' exonuclease and polymerase domains